LQRDGLKLIIQYLWKVLYSQSFSDIMSPPLSSFPSCSTFQNFSKSVASQWCGHIMNASIAKISSLSNFSWVRFHWKLKKQRFLSSWTNPYQTIPTLKILQTIIRIVLSSTIGRGILKTIMIKDNPNGSFKFSLDGSDDFFRNITSKTQRWRVMPTELRRNQVIFYNLISMYHSNTAIFDCYNFRCTIEFTA